MSKNTDQVIEYIILEYVFGLKDSGCPENHRPHVAWKEIFDEPQYKLIIHDHTVQSVEYLKLVWERLAQNIPVVLPEEWSKPLRHSIWLPSIT